MRILISNAAFGCYSAKGKIFLKAALQKVNENPYLKRTIVREMHFHEKWKKV